MQYYKDGFRGGNPDVKQAAPDRRNRGVKADILLDSIMSIFMH